MDAHVISLANQKGGTAKTTTCANLGIGLAQAGRKVLLVDADAQGSLTLSLGWEPDELPITLYDLMIKAIQDRPVTHGEASSKLSAPKSERCAKGVGKTVQRQA